LFRKDPLDLVALETAPFFIPERIEKQETKRLAASLFWHKVANPVLHIDC
jgi:hypothetical protein